MGEVRSKNTKKSLLDQTNAKLVTRRKKRLKRRIIFTVFIFSILIGAFIYLTWRPKFLIKQVDVIGNRVLSINKLNTAINEYLSGRYLYILPNKNAFIFDGGDLEKFLKNKYPTIKEINTNQKIPDYLQVEVYEREPHALWCNLSPNDCVFIDKLGYAYDTAPYFSKPLFTVYELPGAEVNKKVLDEKSFNFNELIIQDLHKNNIIVQKVRPKGEGVFEFDFVLPKAFLVTKFVSNIELGADETLARLYTLLVSPDVAEKNKEKLLKSIDVRFSNQIVYKFY